MDNDIEDDEPDKPEIISGGYDDGDMVNRDHLLSQENTQTSPKGKKIKKHYKRKKSMSTNNRHKDFVLDGVAVDN